MAMKNGIALLAASALGAAAAFADAVKASAEYPEFYNGDTTKGIEFVQAIKVLAPRYCSNMKGNVTVVFEAKGMTRAVAKCWRQPKSGDGWGEDAVLFESDAYTVDECAERVAAIICERTNLGEGACHAE